MSVMDQFTWGTGYGSKRHLVPATELTRKLKPFESMVSWCSSEKMPTSIDFIETDLVDHTRVMEKDVCKRCARGLRKMQEETGELPANGYEPGLQTEGRYKDKFIVQATEPTWGTYLGWVALPTHAENERCKDGCCIHAPSAHSMRGWPQSWRADRLLMERICEHGVGHPDPDDISFKRVQHGDSVADAEAEHGCDGCCAP